MSVAAIRAPSAIYREDQNFAWWLYALLVLMGAFCVLGLKLAFGAAQTEQGGPWWRLEVPVLFAVGVLVPPILLVGVLHMTTVVTPDSCRVWYGWVPTYRRTFSLAEVRKVEIVCYNAFQDHGFWGVRTARDGERILTARGDRGVRIHLSDGSRILIGSQRAEELAAVLEREHRACVCD